MANKKFSEFELKTTTSDVSHIVGYNGAENVQITPANFLDTTGGPYLPLAGGTMTGTNGVVFPDNFYLNLGTSSDFEIYHDGNNSYLKDQGTGELILASNGTGIKLEKTSGEKMIHALTDGAVELYYDSVKKFETTTTGATLTGELVIPEFISHTGDANTKFGFYSTDGFRVYTNGNIMIEADQQSVLLKEAGVEKFRTSSLGATVTGDLLVTGTITGVGGSYLPLAGGTLTGALTGTSATFGGHLQAQNRLTLTDAAASATRYILTNETSTGTGSLQLQAGQGSAAYGGALGMYANSHASKPGDVFAGISSGSGGSFRVNTTGIDSGTDLLTINNTEAIFSPGSSEKMRLDASGNLGLGTSNPLYKLDVQGTATPRIRVKETTDNTQNALIEVENSDGNGAIFGVGGSNRTDILDNRGFISSQTDLDGLVLIAEGADPILFAIGGIATGNEKMRLDASGNVGIGTSSPDAKLQVFGTSAVPLVGGGTFQGSLFSIEGSSTVSLGMGTSGSPGFYSWIQPHDAGGGVNYNLILNPLGGNVGVGTSTPSATMEINSTVGNQAKLKIGRQVGTTNYLELGTSGGSSTISSTGTASINGSLIINRATSTVATESARFDGSGNFLVGTTSSNPVSGVSILDTNAGSYIMTDHLNGTASGTAFAIFRYNQSQIGSITQNGTSAVQFNTSSDYRLKEDLQDFKGLEMVSKIPVYDYKWKAEDSRSYGVMAHELAEVLPQAVSGDKDAEEMQSVDYSKIVPLLVKSIQELSAKLEALEYQCKNK